MKWIVLFFLVGNLFGIQNVDLIHYDPFKKAKKIIAEQKKQKRTIFYKKSKPLIVSGIFNDKVFINGKFYHVGDKIGTYRVKKIEKKKVILQKGDKRLVLYMIKRNYLQMKESR